MGFGGEGKYYFHFIWKSPDRWFLLLDWKLSAYYSSEIHTKTTLHSAGDSFIKLLMIIIKLYCLCINISVTPHCLCITTILPHRKTWSWAMRLFTVDCGFFKMLSFSRQAPHRAFCFAFFLSAWGITISTSNLCLLISHQTHRLLRLSHSFLGPQPASTLEMFLSHTRETCFIYAVNILISLY